jgi:hypothetical protein
VEVVFDGAEHAVEARAGLGSFGTVCAGAVLAEGGRAADGVGADNDERGTCAD